MSRKLAFKRINMDDALTQFIRTSYGWGQRQKLKFNEKLRFYDALYAIDPDIFIKYTLTKLEYNDADIVIPDVRYINEMKALQEAGFIICRVTTGNKRNRFDLYSKNANDGSIAVALQYDRDFAVANNANFSLVWSSRAQTKEIVDVFLERIGYKLDI